MKVLMYCSTTNADGHTGVRIFSLRTTGTARMRAEVTGSSKEMMPLRKL